MDDDIGRELARWGRVALVETRGRVTGRPARAVVGFVEEPDGSLLVAAGDPSADWARNLVVEPACRVAIGELSGDYAGEELTGPERSRAIAQLILRYGAPAERLGAGPAFRLRPVVPSGSDVASPGRRDG